MRTVVAAVAMMVTNRQGCGQIVNSLVLSGVVILVLSGVSDSCYQAYETAKNRAATKSWTGRNRSNKKFFEFLSNRLRRPSE